MTHKFKPRDRVVAIQTWSSPYNTKIPGVIVEEVRYNCWSVKADGPHFNGEAGVAYSSSDPEHLIPEALYNSRLYKALQED